MKRFYSEEPDDDEFNIYDEEEELSDEEMATAYAFIDEGDLMNAMQFDLAETELDQELMDKAIGITKQSWFWSFKSNVKKMEEIEFVYLHLKRIRDHNSEPEEPEKEED